MIQVKITQPGATMAVGRKTEELEVGRVLNFEGDAVPNFLVNKCIVIGESEATELTANEAEVAKLTDDLANSQAQVAKLTDDLAKSQEASTMLGTQLSAVVARATELEAEGQALLAKIAKLEAELVEAKKQLKK